MLPNIKPEDRSPELLIHQSSSNRIGIAAVKDLAN